jgi:hypothetical protein
LVGNLELEPKSSRTGKNPGRVSTARGGVMGTFQLCLIGTMAVTLWSLTKIVVAMIDLLAKLITMAIGLVIALMLLVMVVMHAKPG